MKYEPNDDACKISNGSKVAINFVFQLVAASKTPGACTIKLFAV
jgi:hypothetical protein